MTVIVQWLVCTTTSNKHFTLKMVGRTREFPFLFVLLISRPVIIISCSAIGESYPDGGGSCSFEESWCGWSTDNYGWTLKLNRADDNFIWLTTENLRLSYPAKLKSPELCSTRDGLYLLAFVYTIIYPQDVMLSVYISVHNEEVFLWSSQTGQQGDIKSSELIDLNCTLCRNNSFIIFFKGKKLCSNCHYGEVYLHSVSLHFKGSLQTTSTYVTHSTTVFTDVATDESTTSFPNRTAIGMNGDHSAQCGHENRLPPGAEAAIAIIIMLLIIVIVSIIIMHQRKKKKKTDHGVRWRSNRKKGETTEAVSKSEKISVDNSAHTNDDNQSAKRTTNPGKMYGFKPQNADVELANAATSEDYYVITEDVDRQRTNGNVSNPTVFHTNSHNDFVPDNDYNKLHANPTNNQASPDVYNHLQSSCLQGTNDKEGVYSLANSDVIEHYVNHQYITANAVLDDADEYNRVKASSSKTKDDTYNHLTKDATC